MSNATQSFNATTFDFKQVPIEQYTETQVFGKPYANNEPPGVLSARASINQMFDTQRAQQPIPRLSATTKPMAPELMRAEGQNEPVDLSAESLKDVSDFLYPRSVAVRRLVKLIEGARVFVPSVIQDVSKVTEVTLRFRHVGQTKVFRVYVEKPPAAFERMNISQGASPAPFALPGGVFDPENPEDIQIEVAVPEAASGKKRKYTISYDDATAAHFMPLEDIAEEAAKSAAPAVPPRRTPFYLSMSANKERPVTTLSAFTPWVKADSVDMPVYAFPLALMGGLVLGFLIARLV